MVQVKECKGEQEGERESVRVKEITLSNGSISVVLAKLLIVVGLSRGKGNNPKC